MRASFAPYVATPGTSTDFQKQSFTLAEQAQRWASLDVDPSE